MFYKHIIAILIWVSVTNHVFSQSPQYSFSRLNINNGLSNNQVNCFYKDKQGFLWIGTMSGLNRYDGYHFKIFRHDQKDTSSLADDFISKIVEGPGNKLWIATRSGMNVFDPLTEKFSRNTVSALNEVGIVSNLITDIRKDTKGDFWFLSGRETLYRYSQSAKRSTVVFKTLFQQNEIASFDIGKDGHCYIIHTNGVITILDAATGRTISSNNIPAKVFGSSRLLYSVFTDNDNELWIYFSAIDPKGVLRLNPANGNYTLLEKDKGMPKLNTNLVVSIQQDNQDNIWLSTDHGGINIYNKKTNTIQYLLHNDDDSKSLSQNSITASYQDNTGIIWLGTYKQGISYYHENIIKFPVYRHQLSNPASLPFDDVNRFVEDAKGNIWIGTNGGGLIYYDRAANKFIQYKHQPGNLNSISNNVIVSLFIDHQQKLWIGSYYGGLDCLDNGRFIHYKNDPADPNSLSDNRVWEIYEDSKKNLWVGTLNGGLNRLDREKNIFYHMDVSQQNSIGSNYISALTEDGQGNLWVGTDNGVDVIDNKNNVTHYANYSAQPDGLSNNNIISIFHDSRGLLWIGTRDGLNLFEPKKKGFISFRTNEGLPGNTILNILEDDQKRLWISTNNGVANITVLTDENKKLTIKSVNYDELDGLQSTEFNENAALKKSKSEMIFGGDIDFNIFYTYD